MEIDIANISTPIEAIFEVSDEAFFVVDLVSAEIVLTSPSFKRLDNYYTAVLNNWTAKQKEYLVHQNDRQKKAAFLDELIEAEDNITRSINFRVLNSGGGWEMLELCFKIIKRDLTDKPVLALGKLKKPTNSSSIDGDLNALVKAFNDVVWELNVIDNISRVLAVRREEVLPEIDLGEKLWLDAVHEDDWELASTAWLKANVELKKYDCTVRIKVKSSGYRWVNSKGTPVFNQQGELIKWIGSLTDVEDQIQEEQALQQTLHKSEEKGKELKKLNDLTESFFLIIAHDLRSPISNIKLVFDLIDISHSEEEKLSHLEIIRSSSKRIENIIWGLTDINNIHQGIHSYSHVRLHDVFQKVEQEMAAELDQSCARIETLVEGVPAFNYVEFFAESIIKILLSNAINYAKINQSPLIYISAYTENEFIVLKVQDNGIGIDLKRNLNRIFQPFKRYTEKGSGKGVGLFIVKTILEYNGGFIRLESELESGTTVYCYLKEYTNNHLENSVW